MKVQLKAGFRNDILNIMHDLGYKFNVKIACIPVKVKVNPCLEPAGNLNLRPD